MSSPWIRRLIRCIALLGCLLGVTRAEAVEPSRRDPLEADLPYARDEFGDQDYRYDFEDRHLTFGMDFAGVMATGVTLSAFPYGGGVTPYFRGAFGDGNAIELSITTGFSPIVGSEAEWVFFRTPLYGGSTVGAIAYLAPVLTFKYEIDLTNSIAKKGVFALWAGMGLGSVIVRGEASLTGNGEEPDKALAASSVMFDIVPTVGLKVRMGEFAFLQLGTRYHVMMLIAGKAGPMDVDEEMTTGSPRVVEEFWIGNGQLFEGFLGVGYDFM